MTRSSRRRLRDELGFTPKYTVEEGILAYLNDVRKREACRWNRSNSFSRQVVRLQVVKSKAKVFSRF